jgi:adenosine deaminase
MKSFRPVIQTGHDHFFATFGKFGAATAAKGDMLAAVARVNAAQNMLYLETLVSRQGDAVRTLAEQVGFDSNLAAMRRKLLAGGGMAQIVSAASADTDGDIDRFDELLDCKTPKPQPACALEVRFDYQVGRAVDPEIVFANLLLGFELQRTDPRYVGVNLVQPEDNATALRDYTLQMRMIRYLRSVYPRAHVTLHAGEIVPGLVDGKDLRFHIREAVEIAGAERIGHGVDLVHETGYPRLLRTMARRHVLVEVPLTSNAQILGVSGAAHPFSRYRDAGVPVALATDDPGVSRVDITHEYRVAMTEYDLGYRDLKRLARASLEHSFLPGRSLWRAPDRFERAAACADDDPAAGGPSAGCGSLLQASAKATVQWEQETRFSAFERQRRAPVSAPAKADKADLWGSIDSGLKHGATLAGVIALGVLAAGAVIGIVVWLLTHAPWIRDLRPVRRLRQPQIFVAEFEDDAAESSAKSLAGLVRSDLLSTSVGSAQVDVLTAQDAGGGRFEAFAAAVPSAAKPISALLLPLAHLAARPVLRLTGTMHSETEEKGVGVTAALAGDANYAAATDLWATDLGLPADTETADAVMWMGAPLAAYARHRVTTTHRAEPLMGGSARGWALFRAAQDCAYRGDFAMAKRLCEQAVALGPGNAYAVGLLGQLYVLEGDFVAGVALLNQAAEDLANGQ